MPPPPFSMTLLPTLEVRMMSVFLKSTVRPLESAAQAVAFTCEMMRGSTSYGARPETQGLHDKRAQPLVAPVRRPSSRIWSIMLNTSGCAFSISSNSTTVYGRRLRVGDGCAGKRACR